MQDFIFSTVNVHHLNVTIVFFYDLFNFLRNLRHYELMDSLRVVRLSSKGDSGFVSEGKSPIVSFFLDKLRQLFALGALIR